MDRTEPSADGAASESGTRPRAAIANIVLALPVFAAALVTWKYRDGSDSIVRLHDSLDSYYAIFGPLRLADLFSPPGEKFDLLLGGSVERDALGSEFHFGYILATGLPLMWSLAVSELLIRLMAFFSMRWLLQVVGLRRHRFVVYATATLFSLLPFYLPAFGAVAAAPALIALAVSVWDDGKLKTWPRIGFLAFPLVANAAYVVPYLLLLLIAAGLVAGSRGLGRAKPLFQGSALLAVGMVVVDWRLFWMVLTGPESHRVEMFSSKGGGAALWNGFADTLVAEVSHVWLGKSVLLGCLLGAGAIVMIASSERVEARTRLSFAAALGALLFTAAFARVWPWFEVNVVKELYPSWARFQLGRVRHADPALVYLAAALAAAALVQASGGAAACRRRGSSRGSTAQYMLALLLLIGAVAQGVHLLNSQHFRRSPNSLTPREYYAGATMAEIKAALDTGGKPYRVVSVGFHPAVAVYNEIPSADGYWNQYPLDYKHRFRTLIAPALEADPADASYYDNWGNRAYVFQPELGRPTDGGPPPHGEIDLIVDPVAFAPLGITHVISSVTFANADALGLALVLEGGRDEELGPMYLYEVI